MLRQVAAGGGGTRRGALPRQEPPAAEVLLLLLLRAGVALRGGRRSGGRAEAPARAIPRGVPELPEGRVGGGLGQAKGLYLLELAGGAGGAVVAAPVAMAPGVLGPGGGWGPRGVVVRRGGSIARVVDPRVVDAGKRKTRWVGWWVFVVVSKHLGFSVCCVYWVISWCCCVFFRANY